MNKRRPNSSTNSKKHDRTFNKAIARDLKNPSILTLIDLTKYNNTGELRFGIVRNSGVKEEDPYEILALSGEQFHLLTHIATRLGRHIFVCLCNEHFELIRRGCCLLRSGRKLWWGGGAMLMALMHGPTTRQLQ
jgi:hypothetical protein